MTLIAILLGTLAAGVGSVWLAAALSFAMLGRFTQHMLSFAAGALMATAFLHLLPEAFESQASSHELFAVLLGGLVFFFLLDKAELWHHGHEHNHEHSQDDEPGDGQLEHAHGGAHEHTHEHAHRAHGQRTGGWAVLAGDSVHAFGDGILIAAAFLADLRLGIITSLAVLAHEAPHHMGDIVVLSQTSSTRRAALLKVSIAGTVTAIGGLLGYFFVARFDSALPFFLVLASSSFVYVALADLIPQLQKRVWLRETMTQVVWLGAGIGIVSLVSALAHAGH